MVFMFPVHIQKERNDGSIFGNNYATNKRLIILLSNVVEILMWQNISSSKRNSPYAFYI